MSFVVGAISGVPNPEVVPLVQDHEMQVGDVEGLRVQNADMPGAQLVPRLRKLIKGLRRFKDFKSFEQQLAQPILFCLFLLLTTGPGMSTLSSGVGM